MTENKQALRLIQGFRTKPSFHAFGGVTPLSMKIGQSNV